MDVWKSVMLARGAQCVTTSGVLQMLELYADSLDSVQQVRHDKGIVLNAD